MERMLAKNNCGMTLRRCGRYLWVFCGSRYFKRVSSVTEGMTLLGLFTGILGGFLACVLVLGGFATPALLCVFVGLLLLQFDQEDVHNLLTSRQLAVYKPLLT